MADAPHPGSALGEPAVPPGLHIVFVLAALGAGGAERVVSLVAGWWIEQGHRVTVVAFDREEDAIFHRFDPRIGLVRLGIAPAGGGRAGGLAIMVRRCAALPRALDRLDPDLTISFLTKINVLTLLASLASRRIVAVSERNNPRRQRASRLWTMALRLLLWRADGVVMQTCASLDCLPRRHRRRARVIANPVAIAPITARPEAQPGFTLAAVGRLTWQKGFDLLLQAFAAIVPRHPDWTLVIWGEGEQRPALEEQVRRLELGARVRLPGNSGAPQAWVAGADAFVLSSRYEGFSNVLAEAMAAGLPAVAFDCDYGPAEMIRDGVDGLLVADGDVFALGRALDRLLGEAAIRERLGAAAQEASARLAPAAICREWDALLHELVRSPTADAPVRGGAAAP